MKNMLNIFYIPIPSKTVPPVLCSVLEVEYGFKMPDGTFGKFGISPEITKVIHGGLELPLELCNIAYLTEAALNNYLNC